MNYYNKIAPGYEELYKKEQLKKLNLIAKHIKPNPEQKLLDVGCGSGISTRFWKCKRTGIDTSQELIKIARQKDAEGDYLIASAEKIPFPDDLFDIVTSVTAVHNFRDIERGLREIKRVAKEKVVLSVFKESAKVNEIRTLIRKLFSIDAEFEEDKDIIFIGKI